MCAFWIVGMREVRTVPTYQDRKACRAALIRATAIHPSPMSSRVLQRWISPMTICHFNEGNDTDDHAKRDRCGGVEAGRYDEESSYLQYGKSQTYLCKRKRADEEGSIRWIRETGTSLHFIKAPEKQRPRNTAATRRSWTAVMEKREEMRPVIASYGLRS